jgi:peptidoglycan/LPS O-acetylase OafA/YrhL
MSESIKTAEHNAGVYFPNLNGLRFIAAFLVIIHHVEQIKSLYDIQNIWGSPFIQIIGEQGVVLFFVLSGFLITYLLLEEENQTGAIRVRNFYLRRILRIWPLYFFIGFLALAVLPQIPLFVLPGYGHDVIYRQLSTKIILFTFFLPNLMPFLGGIVPYASQTWSIGTEEQFYLIWPWLMKHIRKYRITLMLVIIFGYILTARALWSSHTDFLPFKYYISGFWSLFNIDCMAIGGFLAILLQTQNRYLKVFRNNIAFYAALLLVSYMLSKGVVIEHVYKETYAGLFGIIILNFASNPNIHFNLEAGIFKYLGKISYGLYMYHPIAIALTMAAALSLKVPFNIFIYPMSVGVTVLLAGLSYKYFESVFLRFKLNYSTIRSGDDISSNPKEPVELKKAIL